MGALFSCIPSKNRSVVNGRSPSIRSDGKNHKGAQSHTKDIDDTITPPECIATPHQNGVPSIDPSTQPPDTDHEQVENCRQTRSRIGDRINGDHNQSTSESTEMSKLQDKIQRQLVILAKGSEEENSEIILGQDLRSFWSEPGRSRFYTEMSWYHPMQNERENAMEKYFKIFSVLIRINFRKWNSFDELFIKANRSDINIPFSLEELSDDKFLGPCNGRLFYTTQWVFCPMIITKKQDPSVLSGRDLNLRFPFIDAGKKVGEGACGVVHHRVIAARHLVSKEKGTENTHNHEVAVKVITQTRFLASELENHKSISRCLTKHANIMVNIATIIREQPITGNVYHIFYELAAYDLEQMLTRDWATNRTGRHRSARSGRNSSQDVRPADFISESRRLVDALDFLHYRLYADAQVSLAHHDLTPRNILVFFPEGAEPDVRYPVGQWKIADFGLSKIKDARRSKIEPKSSSHLHPNDQRLAPDLTQRQMTAKLAGLSLTPAKRPPGRYTPPEINEDGISELNAKMGDVWAFGALFSEILAYAVGEHKLVRSLRKTFEKDEEDRFFDPATKKLKKSFNDWISKLPKRSGASEEDRTWIEQCVVLIRNILVQDASQRFPAAKIRDKLQAIHERHMLGKEQKLLWLSIDTSAASSIQSSRSASAHSGAATASPEELDNLSTTYSDRKNHKSPSFQHKVVQY